MFFRSRAELPPSAYAIDKLNIPSIRTVNRKGVAIAQCHQTTTPAMAAMTKMGANHGSQAGFNWFGASAQPNNASGYTPTLASSPRIAKSSLKIELIAQFAQSSMPLCDLVNRRRREQPVRQGFLAHAGACGGEKFEQSAAAKQIEIGGIHVMRVVEAIARLSVPGQRSSIRASPLLQKDAPRWAISCARKMRE